jgi:hypothetical protein
MHIMKWVNWKRTSSLASAGFTPRAPALHWPTLAAVMMVVAASGCSTPRAITASESTAMVMTPADRAGIQDRRPEFRNVFCAVLEARASEKGVVEDCNHRLLRLADEAPPIPAPVALDVSEQAITAVLVPGFASDCVDETKQARTQFKDYLARFGYHFERLRVSGISSSESNARTIRDAFLADPDLGTTRKAVVVGHSKGVVDTLEALVAYPELQSRISAVISVAGAIGGSPLADIAPDVAVSIARNTPGIQCKNGDGEALESLSPGTRHKWLASHDLPDNVHFYSIVTLPEPGRISAGLKPGYNLLSDIDPRNDGILLFYDQIIPGSTLLGYVNADHWAVATNFDSSQFALIRSLGDKTDFPRQVLLEAALRFVELNLADTPDD